MTRRRWFWPLVALATLLEAAAAASFAIAAFSDPMPRRVADFAASTTEVFGRTLSLSWSTDKGFLVAAGVLAAAGIAVFAAAVRAR